MIIFSYKTVKTVFFFIIFALKFVKQKQLPIVADIRMIGGLLP